MSQNRIVIKGTSDGLIITIGAGDWSGLLTELEQHLSQKASFFKGGRVALRIGPRQLTRPQLEAIGHLLNGHQVSLWAVESEASGTQEAATQLGLETSLLTRPTAVPPVEIPATTGDALVVQRTLRSGQVI
jgi:septum formation inhibitor MinC